MADYQIMQAYLAVLVGRFVRRALGDDRGRTAEEVVLIGAALLGAFAVAGVLWVKLRGGAENVEVPAPAAP